MHACNIELGVSELIWSSLFGGSTVPPPLTVVSPPSTVMMYVTAFDSHDARDACSQI